MQNPNQIPPIKRAAQTVRVCHYQCGYFQVANTPPEKRIQEAKQSYRQEAVNWQYEALLFHLPGQQAPLLLPHQVIRINQNIQQLKQLLEQEITSTQQYPASHYRDLLQGIIQLDLFK